MLAHLTVSEICANDGHRQILAIIEDAHEYLKDQRLEQSFDEAIFKGRRERGQTMTSFLTSKKAAFAELKKQGLDLLSTSAGRHLLGHLLLRQGAFTQDQRQRLKVVTNGSIDYKEIEVAIQKVFGDRLEEGNHYDANAAPRRWRSATFWEGDEPGDEDDWDYGDETYMTEYDEQLDYDDIFEDLVCLTDDGAEAQLIFYGDVPMVIDEVDAIELVSNQIGEIYYQTRERLYGKGKGKGKKGKGKGKSKTFAQSGKGNFGAHGRGGYLEHRRALQANRTGRGFEKPWQQRQGTRMSLSELQARSRCHQCKQVGHWSRECPHRSKNAQPSRPPGGNSGATPMSTGFFLQPPKEMASVATFGTGQQFLTNAETVNQRAI